MKLILTVIHASWTALCSGCMRTLRLLNLRLPSHGSSNGLYCAEECAIAATPGKRRWTLPPHLTRVSQDGDDRLSSRHLMTRFPCIP